MDYKINIMNKYWLRDLQRNRKGYCTGSRIVLILSESHQDLGATEMFFWMCHFSLWCNSCGSDNRIVYKCCLHCSNVVAKDSGIVTTIKSILCV